MAQRSSSSVASAAPHPFSAWLRQRRRVLDLTREALGKLAYCSAETIKKIEGDERLPSKELAGALAEALQVPADQRDAFVQFARNVSTTFVEADAQASDAASSATLPVHASQASPLLETKFFVPHSREPWVNRVNRPRLIALFKAALTRPLVLISASAGFGKTTLASQIDELGLFARIAWLSLDADDNEVPRFLAYLIHACRHLQPGIGEVLLAQLRAPQPPAPKFIITSLINELHQVTLAPPAQWVLVLDDYHVITHSAVHELVASLIDHLPTHLHLVITSRADPNLPLARWRARNQLAEIRTDALRFTPEETAAFFHQTAGFTLPAEQVAALDARTEGWIAGLQLAALSMQPMTADIAGRSAFIAAFSGSNRFVLDYLMDEVLNHQPEPVQSFLLQTSILTHLSGPLCDAVTGQTMGQQRLEQLERGNAFVVALDQNRHWFRYHHLFADVLRSRLQQSGEAAVEQLHRRASAWFEANAMPMEAVHHALAGHDFAHAVDLLEQHGMLWLLNGNAGRVRGWLDRLPVSHDTARPRLLLVRAWLLAGLGKSELAEAALVEIEVALGSIPQANTVPDMTVLEGEMATLRAIVRGTYYHPQALQDAQQALVMLPAQHPMRPLAALSLATTYYNLGRLDDAYAIFSRTLALIGPDKTLLAEQIGLRVSASFVLTAQGHLTQAAKWCAEAVTLGGRDGEVLPNGASLACAHLGVIAYHRNQLDEADQHLNRALQIARQAQSVDAEVYALSYLAWLSRARGDFQGALQAVTQAEIRLPVGAQARFARDALLGLRADLWIDQGDLKPAIEWATQLDDAHERTRPRMTPLDIDRFIRVRVHMAQGDWRTADVLARRLAEDAEATGHGLFLVQALTRCAVAQHELGYEADAQVTLQRALELAQPEGIARPFVDEGRPMLNLLRRVDAPQLRDFATFLLDALAC